MLKILSYGLLRPSNQRSLLLLTQRLLQLLVGFLARLAVERFSLAAFQVKAGSPPAIFALVNAAFAMSASFLFCHNRDLFLSWDCNTNQKPVHLSRPEKVNG